MTKPLMSDEEFNKWLRREYSQPATTWKPYGSDCPDIDAFSNPALDSKGQHAKDLLQYKSNDKRDNRMRPTVDFNAVPTDLGYGMPKVNQGRITQQGVEMSGQAQVTGTLFNKPLSPAEIDKVKIYPRDGDPSKPYIKYGDGLQVVDRPITPAEKLKYAPLWLAYQLKQPQPSQGTPLELAFPQQPSKVKRYGLIGITCCEHIFHANDEEIDIINELGFNFVDDHRLCTNVLNSNTIEAVTNLNKQQATEIDLQRGEIERLKREIEQLKRHR